MLKIPNHTALKEWTSVVAALASGDQVILIRKGGIADPVFGVESERFYLFPTSFHDPGEDASEVVISHWCEVARIWRTDDFRAMLRLEPLVVFKRPDLEKRFNFRPDQALHILGVRTFALPEPRRIASRPAYQGCRSWVSINDEIDILGSQAVLSDGELVSRLARVDQLLSASDPQRSLTLPSTEG